jgi:hypothetical protein
MNAERDDRPNQLVGIVKYAAAYDCACEGQSTFSCLKLDFFLLNYWMSSRHISHLDSNFCGTSSPMQLLRSARDQRARMPNILIQEREIEEGPSHRRAALLTSDIVK